MMVKERARELGVKLHFGEEIGDIEVLKRDYDLVFGADGINSRVRENWR